MKKRALIVGCTGGGLPECAADAKLAAWYLSQRPFGIDCRVLTADLVNLEQWIDAALWLRGADVAVLYYSGHGFRGVYGGQVYTGIWSGVPITHALFEQSVLAPVRLHTGTLVRVYDCCYAGAARGVKLETGNLNLGDGKQANASTIKVYADTDAEPPRRCEHYASVNERDVVIAACGPRQFSYGQFEEAPWSCISTKGHSFFTWSFLPTLWHQRGAGLRATVQSTQWRSNHLLEAFALDSRWRMAPGVTYPLPDVQIALPKKSLDNILTA